MQVEIWSDVVCPWCYIGKRRFEEALGRFEHHDEVEVTWRSFELDPTAPAVREGDNVERLARKYGMSLADAQAAQDRVVRVAGDEGLRFDFSIAKGGNTFDAHRLIHLAGERGGPAAQDAMKERLLRAYFVEGEAIGDHEVLMRLAREQGLDGDVVRAVLDGDGYAEAVRADEREARSLGVSGVPFFVVDRAYGVSGAQPPDVLLEMLTTAWTAAHPIEMIGTRPDEPAGSAECEGDSCVV